MQQIQLDAATAGQFAMMMASGMPSQEAIRYFIPTDMLDDMEYVSHIHRQWMIDPLISQATLALQGKPWQNMTIEERIKFSIDKHYTEMAYFLYSNNYSTLKGDLKAKADTCRQALEAKLAGVAGKSDPMTRFWDDLTSGRVKLPGNVQSASMIR